MLRELRIRNLAVISAVDIEFGPGLTVLTGETGAGKSIVIEAVGLLLGARASGDLVRTGERQASIEAVFQDGPSELMIRREIANGGRSRSYVNGASATAATLKDLSGRLVELHGQHEHQALLDPLTHLPMLDAYAGLDASSREVGELWLAVARLREQLDRAGMDASERQARRDLVEFQIAEIARVNPAAGEDEALEAAKQILSSADRLQRLCADSYGDLYEGEHAALAALARVRRRVSDLADIEPAFVPYAETNESIKSQLEDLALFLRDYSARIDASPERLQQVEDRLAAIERLKRRYGPALDDVRHLAASLREEHSWLAGSGDHAESVRQDLESASRTFLAGARTLSARRHDAARRFTAEMQRVLAELAMAHTQIEVRFTALEAQPGRWSARGIDDAELYISPNPGEDVRPLARIVSGGELSRVMLALKSLEAGAQANRTAGPEPRPSSVTLIFDEVDAGIGGRVADVVGEHLQRLSRGFQLLCITHLPQIAARADEHFRIDKAVRGGRTITTVQRLGPDDRIGELARMLGGDGSGPLREGARTLLDRAQGGRTDAAAGEGPGAKAKGESESPGGAKAAGSGAKRAARNG